MFFATSHVEANLSPHDHREPPTHSEGPGASASQVGRPRVVIFELENGPRVEILELPDSATLGDSFCHSGTEWRVMATRTGDRVLIARPVPA
jgi:hypothetical protein